MNTNSPDLWHGPAPDQGRVLESLSDATPGEIREFWGVVAERGTPFWGEDHRSATFLWRGPHADDAPDGSAAVHLSMNRVTDKHRYEDGFMRHVPGTDVWVRTLLLDADLSVSYGFAPLAPGETPRPGPPRFDAYERFLDPFNPAPPLVRLGARGLSLAHGPEASPPPEWSDHSSRSVAGRVLREDRRIAARDDAPSRPHWLYLPPSDQLPRPAEPLPLLTVFDTEAWFGRLGLPLALEAAVASGRIPPVAVLGIANLSTPDRVASLGANHEFLRGVVERSLPWAEASLRAAGFTPPGRSKRIIAGQSLGGLSALTCCLDFPRAFGHVLAHSPSMWWTPGGASKPKDLGTVPHEDWITRRFSEATPHDVSLWLAVGSREGPSIPHVRALNEVAAGRGWSTTQRMYPGGHDFAWWRVALIDGLEAALGGGR